MSSTAFEGLLWSETNVRTLIPATICMVVFALILRLLIGSKGIRTRNIPFILIGASIVVLEFVKQYRDLVPGPYSQYSLPLHFSSTFLLLIPLAHFTRGSLAETMRPVAGIASGMTTIGMLTVPMTVFGDAANGFFRDFGSFHTIFYHYAILFYFILFVALEMHEPNWRKDAKKIFILITAYTVVAAPLANLLGVNFMSFLYSSIPPVEAIRLQLREAIGAVPAQLLYILFMYVGIIMSCTLSTLLFRGLDALVRKCPKAIRIAGSLPGIAR